MVSGGCSRTSPVGVTHPLAAASSSDRFPAPLAAAAARLPCSPEKDTHGRPDFSESAPSALTRRNALPATFKSAF